MSDQPMEPMDSFESRLSRELHVVSEPALRSVDAATLAHDLATAAPGLRPFPRLGLRPPLRLRPTPRLAAGMAAAVIVAVVGVGAALLMRPNGVAVTPPPSPSPSSASDRAVVDLAELQSSWRSIGTRKAPFKNGNHFVTVDAVMDMVIGPAGITIVDFQDKPVSSASLTADGALQLRLASTSFDWTCQIGAAGTYAARLSPSGQNLTLTPLSDACPERAGILGGVFTRTNIGPLAAGAHVSKLFRPFGATGQLTFATPPGWNESNECAGCFGLTKITSGSAVMISLVASVAPADLGTQCTSDALVAARTPGQIAAWLATAEGLTITKPAAAVVGGLSGVSVDVSALPDAMSKRCSFLVDGSGTVTLADPDSGADQVSVPSTGRARFVLLDRGDGHTLLIDIETDDEATFAAAIGAAMPIVDSFDFAR